MHEDDVKLLGEIRQEYGRLKAALAKAIVGQHEVIERVMICMLAKGHSLLMGVPGLAKTMLVKRLSETLHLSFSRIQFTPDLMPMDITGTDILQDTQGGRREFEYVKGPVFANIVLADELNRASPRTQSALLECMQERQVTVDGVARPLAAPFFVIATQNPIEQDGTFPLPEAQLDRFALRLALGYPEAGAEARMLADQTAPEGSPLDTLAAVADAGELIAAVRACRSVHVAPALRDYVVALCGATRADARLALGASPRAGVTLVRLARAHALIQGRDHVLPDDVKQLARDALKHRLLPAVGAPADVASVLDELLSRVPVPL
jgi:MoxR-like ATPase